MRPRRSLRRGRASDCWPRARRSPCWPSARRIGETVGRGGTAGASADLPPCPVDALDRPPRPVEVKLWHFLSGKTGDTLKALADSTTPSQTKVKVDVESQGTSNDELFKKYQAGMASKDLPAIAGDRRHRHPAGHRLEDGHPGPVVHQGRQLRHDRVPADRRMDYYTVNGVLWPASINLSGALLYYNKGHFQQRRARPGRRRPRPSTRCGSTPRRSRTPASGRQARGPEGQLAAHRDVAHRRRAPRSSTTTTAGAPGTTDAGRVRQRHDRRAVHMDPVDVGRRAAHGHPRHARPDRPVPGHGPARRRR